MTIDKEFESFLFSQDDGEMYSSAYRRAWQAARAIDAKRIAELELENKQAKEAINILNDGKPLGEIVGLHTAQLQLIKIAELEAQNKAMREVLQAYSENKKIGLAATCVLAALDKEGE